jgi:hypothetical protein
VARVEIATRVVKEWQTFDPEPGFRVDFQQGAFSESKRQEVSSRLRTGLGPLWARTHLRSYRGRYVNAS